MTDSKEDSIDQQTMLIDPIEEDSMLESKHRNNRTFIYRSTLEVKQRTGTVHSRVPIDFFEVELLIEFALHHQLFFFYSYFDLLLNEDIEAAPSAYHWQNIWSVDNNCMYAEY